MALAAQTPPTPSTSPAPTPAAAPEIPAPPLVMTRAWTANIKAWAEYQGALRTRAKWNAKLPAGTVTAPDLSYVDQPVQGASSPASNQTLDLYVPPGAGPFPLVIYIHGGAWKGGEKDGEGADMAARWVPEGLAVATVNQPVEAGGICERAGLLQEELRRGALACMPEMRLV